MRNGFRSSRGAMRGIMGGTVGFATVAIGFGPFLYAASLEIECGSPTALTWPDNQNVNSRGASRSIRWPPTSYRHTGRDKRSNKSARSRRPRATEWTTPRRHEPRRPDHEPDDVPPLLPVAHRSTAWRYRSERSGHRATSTP